MYVDVAKLNIEVKQSQSIASYACMLADMKPKLADVTSSSYHECTKCALASIAMSAELHLSVTYSILTYAVSILSN